MSKTTIVALGGVRANPVRKQTFIQYSMAYIICSRILWVPYYNRPIEYTSTSYYISLLGLLAVIRLYSSIFVV